MRKRRFAIGILLVVGLLTGSSFAGVSEQFAEANRLYEAREYQSAVQVYESIGRGGTESAVLYYNLGNAYFKSGDIGHAVLNYLRAQRLDPADEDILHNLEFARRLSPVEMEGVQLNPVTSFLESLVRSYRLNTLAWLSSFFFVLFIGVLVVRFGVGLQTTAVRSAIIIGLVLLVASAGLTTFKYRTAYLTQRIVITADDCPVLNGPSPNADVEFRGAPGLVAEVLRQNGEYYNVLFENKRRGWVKRDLVAEV